jgi:hypothetical protein
MDEQFRLTYVNIETGKNFNQFTNLNLGSAFAIAGLDIGAIGCKSFFSLNFSRHYCIGK